MGVWSESIHSQSKGPSLSTRPGFRGELARGLPPRPSPRRKTCVLIAPCTRSRSATAGCRWNSTRSNHSLPCHRRPKSPAPRTAQDPSWPGTNTSSRVSTRAGPSAARPTMIGRCFPLSSSKRGSRCAHCSVSLVIHNRATFHTALNCIL
jgi:hypothetical protein